LLTILFILFLIYMRHGGGRPFPEDSTSTPLFPREDLELVANLTHPPGNIAVSQKSNRIFFSFHPEGNPPYSIAELVPEQEGEVQKLVARPLFDEKAQKELFSSVLSMRIEERKDGSEILWTLDFAHYAFFSSAKLLGFDISHNPPKLIQNYAFPSNIAGFGSMMNDFQIYDGKIYIADASMFAKTPAIIVYDIATNTATRKLHSHHSVTAKLFDTHIDYVDKDMVILGVFGIRPGVDSIALDVNGEWLYYSAVTDPVLFRVRTSDLRDNSLDAQELGKRVQEYANKTMSDGIIMDKNFIYISDMEHSAILRLGVSEKVEGRKLETLFKLPGVLRWPDGFSFGKDGWIYVTCSSLENVVFKTSSHMNSQAPYHIFRFKQNS